MASFNFSSLKYRYFFNKATTLIVNWACNGKEIKMPVPNKNQRLK